MVLDLVVLRTRLVTRRAFWTAYAICLFFQLVVNGVLTSRGLVTYAPRAIAGQRLAYAPVEDIAFGFSLVLQTLAWWVWWGRGARPAPTQAGAGGPEARGGAARAPGPHHGGYGDRSATCGADARAPVEHPVVGSLDLVEDAAVKRQRGADAVAAGRVEQPDAGLGLAEQLTCTLRLEGKQSAGRRCDDATLEIVARDRERSEVLLRQVDPVATQI